MTIKQIVFIITTKEIESKHSLHVWKQILLIYSWWMVCWKLQIKLNLYTTKKDTN